MFLQDLDTKLTTINNAVIQLGDIDDSGKGRRFISKFIQPGLVKIEGHGIVLLKKETLDASLQTIVGSPVIIEHQNVTENNADNLRCGVIAEAQYNEFDGWYYVTGIIWDTKAQELINNGWSVSCSYDYLAVNDTGGEENNIHYDKEFTELNFTHLAIVNNPRYERANIVFNSKVENKNDKHEPAGAPDGKGGQFAKSEEFKESTFFKDFVEGKETNSYEWKNSKIMFLEALLDGNLSKENKKLFKQIWQYMKEQENNIKNSKETDMNIVDKLQELINSVKNNKENEMEIENEKVDKRKLIDEVAGIMKSAGCDDEDIRTAIKKMEEIGYEKSEKSADNEKEDDKKDDDKKVDNKEEKEEKEDKKVENESEEDKKKAEDLEKEEKEDVENRCYNSKGNEFFEKMNKIYNSVKKIEEAPASYESRQQRLEEGAKYF